MTLREIKTVETELQSAQGKVSILEAEFLYGICTENQLAEAKSNVEILMTELRDLSTPTTTSAVDAASDCINGPLETGNQPIVNAADASSVPAALTSSPAPAGPATPAALTSSPAPANEDGGLMGLGKGLWNSCKRTFGSAEGWGTVAEVGAFLTLAALFTPVGASVLGVMAAGAVAGGLVGFASSAIKDVANNRAISWSHAAQNGFFNALIGGIIPGVGKGISKVLAKIPAVQGLTSFMNNTTYMIPNGQQLAAQTVLRTVAGTAKGSIAGASYGYLEGVINGTRQELAESKAFLDALSAGHEKGMKQLEYGAVGGSLFGGGLAYRATQPWAISKAFLYERTAAVVVGAGTASILPTVAYNQYQTNPQTALSKTFLPIRPA